MNKLLCGKSLRAPVEAPKAALGSSVGRGDKKVATWLYEPASSPLAHLWSETLGLENPQIKSPRRNSCFVLKYLLHSTIISHVYYLSFIVIRHVLFINYRYSTFINIINVNNKHEH